jgi:hypothetical protein
VVRGGGGDVFMFAFLYLSLSVYLALSFSFSFFSLSAFKFVQFAFSLFLFSISISSCGTLPRWALAYLLFRGSSAPASLNPAPPSSGFSTLSSIRITSHLS